MHYEEGLLTVEDCNPASAQVTAGTTMLTLNEAILGRYLRTANKGKNFRDYHIRL